MSNDSAAENRFILQRSDFHKLLDALRIKEYQIYGPQVQNSAIVLDEVSQVDDLPVGISDLQGKASYHLKKRDDGLLFGFVVGPQSWKKFLYPPMQELCAAHKTHTGWKIVSTQEDVPKMAFLGVRPCELYALNILDRVLIEGDYQDPNYKSRRQNTVIIAVNCIEPGNNCFCASMNIGPKAQSGYDVALTEMADEKEHYFLVELGSETGAYILSEIPLIKAEQHHIDDAANTLARAALKMVKTVNTEGLKELLQRNLEHPQWKEIAASCLTCANCTMVCPTCFCTTIEDYTDLHGKKASRCRKWDSCFTMAYSYIHGGSVRYSVEARYRQWMTHKFANWLDQFGVFGCVGCGRCITWCPAGIDITEEIRNIRESEILQKAQDSV